MEGHNSRPAVLVVEDDQALRRLIVRMLESRGYVAVSASKAADALKAVRERRGAFDLAIVDIIMPGISGLDLACDFDREFPALKILYISGYANSVAADVLLRRSPEIVLLKPFTVDMLLTRVRMLLERLPRRKPVGASLPSLPEVRNGTLG